jgi:hypothetical protein
MLPDVTGIVHVVVSLQIRRSIVHTASDKTVQTQVARMSGSARVVVTAQHALRLKHIFN